MFNRKRILVVEDDASIREAIALALKQEGYEVVEARNGADALEIVAETTRSVTALPIDLIVLDVMLPQVNGLDICRILRRQNNLVPILIISARSSETDRVVGLEVGADDYLSKPFGMRELLARCRVLLRRTLLPASPEQSTLNWKEIKLDTISHEVTCKGENLALSPKEYRLLELFMKSPRRVWNRDQLIERVWGDDFMGDAKTVDVHIRWLREKIEEDPSNPQYIVTIRGFGYRLE
jgi:two-component system, OmpR family, phosphate regulon response regulator PhoB